MVVAGVTGAGAARAPARMTGGGWIGDPNIIGDPDIRIHVNVNLDCGIGDPEIRPPHLQVHSSTFRFRLRRVTATQCSRFDNKRSGFLGGSGIGECDGQEVDTTFQLFSKLSAEEPQLAASADARRARSFDFVRFSFTGIEDPNIRCPADLEGELRGGSLQMIGDPEI